MTLSGWPRAAEHDVAVQLQVWPRLPHVFQGFAALVDEADDALRAATGFTKAHWVANAEPQNFAWQCF
jgi:acetyl esterase/lipase